MKKKKKSLKNLKNSCIQVLTTDYTGRYTHKIQRLTFLETDTESTFKGAISTAELLSSFATFGQKCIQN